MICCSFSSLLRTSSRDVKADELLQLIDPLMRQICLWLGPTLQIRNFSNTVTTRGAPCLRYGRLPGCCCMPTFLVIILASPQCPFWVLLCSHCLAPLSTPFTGRSYRGERIVICPFLQDLRSRSSYVGSAVKSSSVSSSRGFSSRTAGSNVYRFELTERI